MSQKELQQTPEEPQRRRELPDCWMPGRYRDNAAVTEFLDNAREIYRGAWDEERWTRYYDEALGRILDFVRRNSVLYSERLTAAQCANSSRERLKDLPFTTKQDLRSRGEDVFSSRIDEGTIYYETTGTLGAPVRTPRTWFESFASNLHFSFNLQDFAESMREEGCKPIVGIMGPTDLHPLGDSIGDICRNIDVSHLKFWPYSPKVGLNRAAEVISELGVNVLFGSPANMLPVMKYAEENRRGSDSLGGTVHTLLLLGEVTSDAMLKNLGSLVDGARCMPGCYGAAETYIVSSTCRHGRMHVSRQNYITETIDPETLEATRDGGTGELVLTSLIPGIRPMIRYRTGDLVSWDTSRCECGNPVASLVNHGRVADILSLNGRSLSAREMEQALLAGMRGIYGYHIDITNEAGTDRVVIRIMASAQSNAKDMVDAQWTRNLAQRLNAEMDIRFVDELPAAVNASGLLSWKSAKVKDHRHDHDAEREAAEKLASEWLNGLNR